MSLTISRLILTLSTLHRYLDDFLNFKHSLLKYSDYKKIGYNSNVLQQTVCLVVNQITVGNYAFLLNCIHCFIHIRQFPIFVF